MAGMGGRPPDYDVMFTNRQSVKSNSSGQTKPFWIKLGSAWKTKKGISITLDVMPVGEWNGKMMLFERDNQARSERRGSGVPPPVTQPEYDDDDDGSPL